MESKQTSCKQCGICCTKGGAALHSSDITLLQQGRIPYKDLITIRKSEFAYNPVTDAIQATKAEIVKLRGSGREWSCCYYDKVSCGCTIYTNRPMACEALKCWDPAKSLALVETDLLSRFDILKHETPLLTLMEEYERTCPLPDFASFPDDLSTLSEQQLETLEDMVNRDLLFRDRSVANSSRVLEEEMFLFGRPIFQMLQSFGFTVMQSGKRLRLKIQK